MNKILHKIVQGWDSPGIFNYLLRPVSWIYRLLIAIRQIGYQTGVFKSHTLPVPVIVVGNITVGGTGKTPLVVALIDALQRSGFSPGIISRGYKGELNTWPHVVTTDSHPKDVGDEPILLLNRTAVPVVVGPNRYQSGKRLLDNFDCDIIVSDDGFQHFAMMRNMDIIVVDAAKHFGNGWCLPAGPLREPISALKRAALIVMNSGHQQSPKLGHRNPEDQFTMQLDIKNAVNLITGAVKPLSAFKQATVHAVAGIGHPNRFFDQLNQLEIKTINHAFEDHHDFSPEDFIFDQKDKEEQIPILMTEKDAVKCRWVQDNLPNTLTNDYWYVPATAKLPPEFEKAIMTRIR